MEKLHQDVKQLVPQLRLTIAARDDLRLRFATLEQSDEEQGLVQKSIDEQVAYLKASRLAQMGEIFLGGVIINLAHSEEAFAMISAELDPHIAEHARDTVADEVVYAPLRGISAEAAITAALSTLSEDLTSAGEHFEKAKALLSGISA